MYNSLSLLKLNGGKFPSPLPLHLPMQKERDQKYFNITKTKTKQKEIKRTLKIFESPSISVMKYFPESRKNRTDAVADPEWASGTPTPLKRERERERERERAVSRTHKYYLVSKFTRKGLHFNQIVIIAHLTVVHNFYFIFEKNYCLNKIYHIFKMLQSLRPEKLQ